MPVMEMRIMGPEREFLASLLKVSRLAIKSPVLKLPGYVRFKDIKFGWI
jgi:hypothetical protein